MSKSKYTLNGPSRIPISLWARVVLAALLGHERSPTEDGSAVLRTIEPPMSRSGAQNLPDRGPYIVVANHLNGPGVWVGLAAALIAGVIGEHSHPARIRGVGVAAYRDFKLWRRIPVPDAVTEWLFGRFYSVYDIIRMPHVSEGAGVRSGAVRRILAALKRGDIVLLFPEGRNVANFRMRDIQDGVGDLLRLVSRSGAPVIPIAVAPSEDSFVIQIGEPLKIAASQTRPEVEQQVGLAIAGMLPLELRGPFGGR